jgi:hypothetical protein
MTDLTLFSTVHILRSMLMFSGFLYIKSYRLIFHVSEKYLAWKDFTGYFWEKVKFLGEFPSTAECKSTTSTYHL